MRSRLEEPPTMRELDADRCYYGSIDEDGGIVKRTSRNVRQGIFART